MNCVFKKTILIELTVKSQTATENADFNFPRNFKEKYMVMFSLGSRSHEIIIDIIDDNLIEPFEFFTVHVTPADSFTLGNEQKVIYIQDDDYNTGVSQPIHDVFNYQLSQESMNPVYLDQYQELIYYPNEMAIFPDQGGITSTYKQLLIKIELLSADPYSYHTIEVHNPNECNLKKFHFKRLDMMGNNLDTSEINSIYLNGNTPIIDIEYAKRILNKSEQMVNDSRLKEVQILELWFDTTKDGENPGKCELRAFANQIR